MTLILALVTIAYVLIMLPLAVFTYSILRHLPHGKVLHKAKKPT